MDLSISGLMKTVSGYFKKMSKGKRISLGVTAAALVVGAVILVNVLENASYTVLYRGLSSTESVEIVNLLDSSGVDYKLETDGAILVPRDSEASIKMQLAAEGFPQSTLGYDIFTSQSDLTTTDYERRQYLIFQLQDRLQAALKTLSGVRDAIVTLNVAEENDYVLKSEAPESSASVVLDLYSYAELNKKQIRGIEELVAKSVPGLTTENVIVVDSQGNVLNSQSSDYGVDLANSQIEAIDNINRMFEEKITRFLEPVFGSDGVSVAVNTQVDFKQKSTEQTTYSPVIDNSGILSKQQVSQQNTNGGQVTGGVAGTEGNTGTPTYDEDDDEDKDTSASASSTSEYLINQVVESALDNGGRIEDMTVSVMINSRELSEETVQKYREMVAYGVGIATEKVFITYAEFLAKPDTPVFTDTQDNTILGLTPEMLLFAGAGLLTLILLFIILLFRSRRRKKTGKESSPTDYEEMAEEAGASVTAPEQPSAEQPRPAKVPMMDLEVSNQHGQDLKRQVKEFAKNSPEITAQLLRAWIKEGDSHG